jgi:hypothetical protein
LHDHTFTDPAAVPSDQNIPPPPKARQNRHTNTAKSRHPETAVYVQVSSQRTEPEAKTAFTSLQATFPTVLGNQQPIIRRADLGSKGIYYRAVIGPYVATQADQLCNNLKAAGGQCLIQSF